MNQNQELKMRLLEKYGDASDKKSIDFCREAYKFIVEGDMIKLEGINAITGEVFAERVPFTPTSSEPVAVDLGLPSGTLWCDRNVGAKSVEDYGAYISWGNKDYYEEGSLGYFVGQVEALCHIARIQNHHPIKVYWKNSFQKHLISSLTSFDKDFVSKDYSIFEE